MEIEEDFLEVDTPIPGQNYCCLSFLSPNKVMKDKNAFYITQFLKAYCKDKKIEIDDVEKEYKDFAYKHAEQLQKDFDDACDFINPPTTLPPTTPRPTGAPCPAGSLRNGHFNVPGYRHQTS